MARVTIRIDIGPGASLGALASVVNDLSALQDLGLRTDRVAARREAASTIERRWRESPGDILERSRLTDELAMSRIHDLVDRRRRDDEVVERMLGTPPELWLEEWFYAQRRGRKTGRFTLPPLWALSEREFELATVAPDIFSSLVEAEAAVNLPSVPAVERLTYSNPIELVLLGVGGLLTGAGFKFGTFTELAKLIRDWSSEKERSAAEAREAAAVADQAEIRVDRERSDVARSEAETREILARASKTEMEAEILRRYAVQGNRIDDLVEAGLASPEIEAMASLSAAAVDVEIDEPGT